ncbi:MAG: hypothetical protein J6Q64_03495 [Clostridia bacterium]|nr:hypothetical protein [Clostridia bacterium]
MVKGSKIFKISVKVLFYLFVIIVNAIMLWRVLFSGDPAKIQRLTVNDSLREAYEDGQLLLETQEQRTLTSNGLFAVRQCIFIPEANQIQIVVRYNNSTLRKLAQDYGLESVPEKTDELFDVSIVKTIDKTPMDITDNTDPEALSEERYHPTGEPETAYKRLYSYRRYVFENVSREDAVGMFVDVYYKGDVNYEKDPYGALCIYEDGAPMEEVKLTGADKKELKKGN